MRIALKIVLGILAVLLLLTACFFSFRNSFITKKVNEKVSEYSKKHKVHISFQEVGFEGLSSVKIKKLAVIPAARDTLIWLGDMSVSIDLLPALWGKYTISQLQLHQLYLRPKDIKGKRNFDFLLKKDTASKSDEKRGYSAIADRIIGTLFDLIPSAYKLSDFRIIGQKDTVKTIMLVPQMESAAGEYDFWAGIYESKNKSYWHFIGQTNKQDREVSGKMIRRGAKGLFPILKSTLDLSASVQELDFSFADKGFSNGELNLRSAFRIKKLEMEHWRISPKLVKVDTAGAEFDVKIGQDFVEIDSTSHFTIANMSANPYFCYHRKPERVVALKLNMPETPSQDFFDAFPSGLFSSVERIKTEGKLAFHLNFSIHIDHPEKVVYDAGLKPNKFKILKMGATNLSMMRDEFLYTAFEKGVPFTTFAVGESNPDFVPLEKINPLLQQAVLSSEDGSFFGHQGFNMETFASSITANFKEKRFVRGASTISMQLVKNVFLTRNKTIARKLEEILIVWLIENQRLTSKERMYEVYLNVIEWGPEIYGIGQASEFYFNKSARNLTLNESIFLSAIVPSPKYFRYRFDATGHLKPELEHYFKVISGHLVKRGILPEEIRKEMIFGVELTGPAAKLLKKAETVVPDSTLLELPVVE